MFTSVTIVRYPRFCSVFGFFAMALHHLPLKGNQKISFYKLMGSGNKGGFGIVPSLRTTGIIAVHNNLPPTNASGRNTLYALYGKFIAAWWKLFNCRIQVYLLQPIKGHGKWNGGSPFEPYFDNQENGSKIAVLTRASVRLSKLKYFWKQVAPVAAKMKSSPGLLEAYGIGEAPWVRQATFSIWESQEAMTDSAYSMQSHKDVIKKTKSQSWYSEDMYVRFRVISEYSITEKTK